MSIDIQKQIKDNATSVSDFFSDLYKWTEEQEKVEKRREIRKVASKVGVKEAQQLLVEQQSPGTNGSAAPAAVPIRNGSHHHDEDDRSEPIRRDGNAMAQYYNDWDQYDPDAEVDKIEDEAFRQQKAERDARQAEKDRILDEMALKPNGDRSRTSTARPRVKVSVRRSGRKVAPVDLAAPRKDEANRLFGAGRYREAIASYTAALDCLDKYEPPAEAAKGAGQNGEADVDSPGQEQEAIALKVALLANRALACFKLEDWRECVVDASEALRFEPGHHKATLRRGFALARMKRWGAAANDLALAVGLDSGDKKAVAELQMARRMLSEQAKEARAHAKCVMCDPTRYPTMPTRKLTVKVRRSDNGSQPSKPVQEVPEKLKPPPVEEAIEKVPEAERARPAVAATKRTYVPRSAGLRSEAASKNSGGKMSMNFYQFEAQWNRLRGKPADRATLLQKVGASALPALFRESLDSELVCSISEALAAQLKEGAGHRFAVEVLQALSRTPRFELSIHCLTGAEKAALDEVLTELRGDYAQEVEAIEGVYVRRAPAAEEVDEDDVPEVAAAPTATPPAIVSLDGCD